MFFIRLLSRLSLPALYLVSDLLFFISYYIVRYRRHLVKKNLSNAFPDKDPETLQRIEKEFYQNLCDYAVEMLKLVTMPKQELLLRMKFIDLEVMEKFKAANQCVLFFASHQFNWEWLLVSGSACHPMPIDFVYQSVNSKFFDQLSMTIRTRFGAYPIRRDEVARELIKRKDILRTIATVADQYPGYGRDKKFITRFLNQETAFFMAANQLAQMSQFPALYYKTKKIKRGFYEATPTILALPPYPKESLIVIEKYVEETERVIKEYPAGWLWSHNRWKTRHLKNPLPIEQSKTSTH